MCTNYKGSVCNFTLAHNLFVAHQLFQRTESIFVFVFFLVMSGPPCLSITIQSSQTTSQRDSANICFILLHLKIASFYINVHIFIFTIFTKFSNTCNMTYSMLLTATYLTHPFSRGSVLKPSVLCSLFLCLLPNTHLLLLLFM